MRISCPSEAHGDLRDMGCSVWPARRGIADFAVFCELPNPIRATLPYASADPPYNHQAPKIPTLIPTRPAFPAPQIRHPRVSANSLRRLPARYRMSRRSTNPPRPAAGFPRIYTPTLSRRFHGPTTGGHGRQCAASLRDATTLRRRRRRQGEPEPACHSSA